MTGDTEIDLQLKRILDSDAFIASARSAQFLEFCVVRAQTGRLLELKETTIGVELFLRPADYDPKTDSIVRVHARRVREKLQLYYRTAGANDPIRIELPKGGYIPQIARVEPASIEPTSRQFAPEPAIANYPIDSQLADPQPLDLSRVSAESALNSRHQAAHTSWPLIALSMFAIAIISFFSAWIWKGRLAPSPCSAPHFQSIRPAATPAAPPTASMPPYALK